jgi:hypothetical protein
MNIYNEQLITLVSNLEYYYLDFWKHIFYDDSKVHYKHAIMFYKNNENGKSYNFFSGRISKFLYTGRCDYIDNKHIYSNRNIIPSSDELCKLIKTNINILDTVFTFSPKLPNNIITFREEFRDTMDASCNLKKNDIIEVSNYWSTTLHSYDRLNTTGIVIQYIINLPKNTRCYYINNPFFLSYEKNTNKVDGMNEYEIVLPRNCIYRVLRRIKLGNTIIYTLDLVKQLENMHVDNNYEVPTFKKIKKDIGKLSATKLKPINIEMINQRIKNIKYVKSNVKLNGMHFNFKIVNYIENILYKNISYINKIKNNKLYKSFIDNSRIVTLKTKYIYIRYDNINNTNINFFKNIKLNTNQKYDKIFAFYDTDELLNLNLGRNTESGKYKSNTINKITKRNLSNHLFTAVTTEPLYIIIKLYVNKKFNYYELPNLTDIWNVSLDNKFTLQINSRVKRTIGKYFYYDLIGTLS